VKIKRLEISDNISEPIVFDFSSRTLIFSENNSTGKTTLIRFILHGFGYDVSSTKGLNFNDYNTALQLVINNTFHTVERGKNIKGLVLKTQLKNGKYSESVFETHYELHAVLFNSDSKDLLDNILGIYYIDQEYGLLNWNKGTVIGSNKFNITKFISGLQKYDFSYEEAQLHELRKERDRYTSFINFKKQTSTEDRKFSIQADQKMFYDNLTNERSMYQYKIKKLKTSLNDYTKAYDSNSKLKDLIEKLDLYIIKNDEKPFKIEKHNIYKYDETVNWLKAKILDIQEEIKSYNHKISSIDFKLNENRGMFDEYIETTMDKIFRITSEIDITENEIESINESLKRSIKDLETTMEEKVIKESKLTISSIVKDVERYLNAFEIDEIYSLDEIENMLFMKRNDKYSGRVLSHIAYAFKLAYIKSIKEKIGLVLPIIIDSPTGKEMTIENFNKVLKVIDKDFKDHNLILASIYNYDIQNLKIITLKNQLFDSSYYQAK
jgi:flagellar biosynthesis regulator FlbT